MSFLDDYSSKFRDAGLHDQQIIYLNRYWYVLNTDQRLVLIIDLDTMTPIERSNFVQGEQDRRIWEDIQRKLGITELVRQAQKGWWADASGLAR